MTPFELNDEEIAGLDATAQAQLVARGDVSPADLVESAIRRIEKLNPDLNAVIHRHFERARDETMGALPDGPFKGVPFLLKDLGSGHRAGDPNFYGTRFLRDANYRPDTTSFLVQKFLAAGLVIVGRTNVPELGAWTTTEPASYGATRNPWNPEHSCGGSSGGAGAAVAAGMVPLAHANDGGGSIRNPASQNGLVGLKPTRGRVSSGPDMVEGWAGLIHEFAVCRSVRDTAALLDAVEGAMPGDLYHAPPPARPYIEEVGREPGRLRVGLLDSLPNVEIAPECRDALASTGRLLEELGHDVEVAQPEALGTTDLTVPIITIIATSQARDMERFGQALGRALGREDVDSDNWAVTEIGQKFTAVDYQRGLESFHRFRRGMAAWWAGGFDLLVTPTLPEPPPPLGELVPDPEEPLKGFLRSARLGPFLMPFNITGQPAISLPLHWSAAGLPIGVQLVSAYAREDVLFTVSAQLERAAPWADRRPPIHAAS